METNSCCIFFSKTEYLYKNYRFVTVCMQSFDYLVSECVWGNSGAQLDDKDECQKDWKWQRHAMVFLDGSTAAEKSDEENDASDNH